MRKICYLFFILVSFQVLAAERLDISFVESEVRQGALVKGKLLIQPGSVNLPVQKLKGATIGDTIYFQQLSTPLKKEGSSSYESEIKVIFVKVPDSELIQGTLGQNEIIVHTGGIRIIPVDAPGKMLWAEFSAPDFLTRNWKWVWMTLVFIILAVPAYLIVRKILRRKKIALRRKKLVTEFRSCSSYEDVVTMWKNKRHYLEPFPHIEESFRKFEEILFRYQFKPHQTEAEKEAVMAAYKKLLQDTEGGFRGI